MRNIILITFLLLTTYSISAQKPKPDYAALKRIMLSSRFDLLDSLLQNYEYHFEQTRQIESDSVCYDAYVWKRYNLGSGSLPSNYETMALFRKCKGAVWYSVVRYLSFDQKHFNQLITECRSTEKMKYIGESTESGCVVRQYREGNFVLLFKNCFSDRQEYHIEMVYDFPF